MDHPKSTSFLCLKYNCSISNFSLIKCFFHPHINALFKTDIPDYICIYNE
jgi:hypothetical protein